jgi:hypothetical protein
MDYFEAQQAVARARRARAAEMAATVVAVAKAVWTRALELHRVRLARRTRAGSSAKQSHSTELLGNR